MPIRDYEVSVDSSNITLLPEELFLLDAIRDKSLSAVNFCYEQIEKTAQARANLRQLRLVTADIPGQSYFHVALTQSVSEDERKDFDHLLLLLMNENALIEELYTKPSWTPVLLQKLGALFNVDDNGESTLLSAARYGHLEALKKLFDLLGVLPADFPQRDFLFKNRKGTTLLHAAAKGEHIEVVRFLIDTLLENEGPESLIKAVNAMDVKGNRPLHMLDDTVTASRIAIMLACAGADYQADNFARKKMKLALTPNLLTHLATNGAFIGANISLEMAIELSQLSPNHRYILLHTLVENRPLQISNGLVMLDTRTIQHRKLYFQGAMFELNTIREWFALQSDQVVSSIDALLISNNPQAKVAANIARVDNVVTNIQVALRVAQFYHPNSQELNFLTNMRSSYGEQAEVPEGSLTSKVLQKFFSSQDNFNNRAWESFNRELPPDIAFKLPKTLQDKLQLVSKILPNNSINSKPRSRQVKNFDAQDDNAFTLINECLQELNNIEVMLKTKEELNVPQAIRGFSAVTFYYALYSVLMAISVYNIINNNWILSDVDGNTSSKTVEASASGSGSFNPAVPFYKFGTWMGLIVLGGIGFVAGVVLTVFSYRKLTKPITYFEPNNFMTLWENIKKQALDKFIAFRKDNPDMVNSAAKNKIKHIKPMTMVLGEFKDSDKIPSAQALEGIKLLKKGLVEARNELILHQIYFANSLHKEISVRPKSFVTITPITSVSSTNHSMFSTSIDMAASSISSNSSTSNGKEADDECDEATLLSISFDTPRVLGGNRYVS